MDALQNIYLFGGFRIRKISASTGLITTIAGTGSEGYSGDEGPAIDAQLGKGSIAVDKAGNLYLSDESKNCLRKINASDGKISLIAGTPGPNGGYSGDNGPAVNAKLMNPNAVVIDAAGNLFIADRGNRRIRKIDANTGAITTVAGNGQLLSAGDGGPALSASILVDHNITLDKNGNIFIAEPNRIRMINVTTGTINTIAGTGEKGYNGEGVPGLTAKFNDMSSIATDAPGNIYVSETGDHRIRKISKSDGKYIQLQETVIPGTPVMVLMRLPTRVYFPFSLQSDVKGNIYFMDNYNSRVRKIYNN